MPILFGPFDPIKLILSILNELLANGIINYDKARKILKNSIDPNMPDEDKEKFLDSIIKRTSL